MPLYSTIGNHELIAGDHAPWAELYGRANFSFAFKGARFTFVDTASASLHPRVYTWLDGWLDEGADVAHVFIGHITPFDPAGLRHGAFRSRREGAKLLARLADHDVDLTLYGHIHSLDVFSNAGATNKNGNINAAPEFVDPAGNDFTLKATSPCIDRGIDSGGAAGASAVPSVDRAGQPRKVKLKSTASSIDIGAFERQGP